MGNDNSVKNKTIAGLMWRFMERCGAQGVNFVVSIILARLLEPKLYGVIALVTVFITILQVFIDSGMGNALIQKLDADDLDFSSVFYFNIFMCGILYVGIFIAAPFIAKFYHNSELTAIVRVMSLVLVVSGVKNIQQAYVSKHMLFKKFFFSTLGGTIVAAVVGIIMAYEGFGVWALVMQNLVNTVIDTAVLWATVKWRPKVVFSMKRLKCLISFGWKLLVSGLLDTVYQNIRQLIIGKMYSSADLAYYNRGKQFPNVIMTNVDNSIDSVLFPVLSAEQNDKSRVKVMTRQAIKMSSYIMWPLMMGMAFTATPLVRLLLTDKWIACVPFLQIFCITYAFRPIHTANLNAIKAMGRSDLFMKLEIIKKIVGIAALLCTMWFGVLAMAYSLLFTNVINQVINSWPNKKLLGYSYLEQLKDIAPAVLLSLAMGLLITPIGWINLHDALTLLIQVVAAVIIYIGGSKLLHIDTFDYFVVSVKGFLNRNK